MRAQTIAPAESRLKGKVPLPACPSLIVLPRLALPFWCVYVCMCRRAMQSIQMATMTTACNLGFLTVLQEPAGFVGGYLVTNQWGRPLEFRLSTAVQPNRVQQILYGTTLQGYICADLIGKTLVDKTVARPQFLFTDSEHVLNLRLHVSVPVAWLPISGDEAIVPSMSPHPQFPEDGQAIAAWLTGHGKGLDLAEPFVRIREALAEARKMGVTNRA